MSLDERWEKVSAHVRPYIWPFEDSEVVPESPVTEFLIEVIYGETVWYCRILVFDAELNEFPNLYGETLNEMVKNLDGRLNNGSIMELGSRYHRSDRVLPGRP